MCNLYAFVASSLRRFPVLSLSLLMTLLLSGHVFADQDQKTQNHTVSSLNHPPITEGWEPIEEKTASKTVVARDTSPDLAPSLDKDAQKNLTALSKIRASLTDTDYVAALQAIHVALSQVGDGKRYLWHTSQNLRGQIEPTHVFRDTDGRICRHVIYTLYVSKYSKTIEGIACRTLSGRWDLSG